MTGRKTPRQIQQDLRNSDAYAAIAGGLGVLSDAPTSAPFGADVDPVFGPAAARSLSRPRIAARGNEAARRLAERNDASIAEGQRAAQAARAKLEDEAVLEAALPGDGETVDDDASDVDIFAPHPDGETHYGIDDEDGDEDDPYASAWIFNLDEEE